MFYYSLLYVFIINRFYFVVNADIVFPCKTPDDERAYCVSLFACPHLMKALGGLDPLEIDYVKQSICLGCEAGDFMVCCGTPPKFPIQNQLFNADPPITTTATVDSPVTATQQEELIDRFNNAVKDRLLPNEVYCGFQHTDDREYNSSVTALDEFPWLVHIRFSHHEYDGQFADRCTGVLINNRYVLTDAYCGAEAIKVKLGEYNTNETVSKDSTSHLEEISEPVIDVNVEEIIRDGDSTNGPYDFTLLRLSKPIDYSDFIRPICLPIDQAKRPKLLKSLLFSGWGARNATGVPKKRLNYNIVSDEVCYKEEPWLEGNVKHANVSFICTSPPAVPTGLACSGEHGGPFMYTLTRRLQWYVEGVIVNVIYKDNEEQCNSRHPVNGIRITESTIDWILATIRE